MIKTMFKNLLKMTKRIVEQDIEDAALDILENDLGYDYLHGKTIEPFSENPLRSKWDDVIIESRLKEPRQ